MVRSGVLLMIGSIGLVIRVERLEGVRHLLDLDWILNDDMRSPVVTGKTASIMKLVARAGLAVGAGLVVVGLVSL